MADKISIVIPFIHEYPAVYMTINNLQAEMKDCGYDWEIIAAENSSQDTNTSHAFVFEGNNHRNPLYRVPQKKGLIKYVFEPRQCYSDDTEVLTENGWKLFKDLVGGERVATLNQITGYLEYEIPTDYIKYWFSGKMFSQLGSAIDVLVTPDHLLWLDKPKDKKVKERWRFVEAKESDRRVRYKRNARWVGVERNFFTLPAYHVEWDSGRGYAQHKTIDRLPKNIDMDDWLAFLGIWLSDGGVAVDSNGVSVGQNPDSKTYVEIGNLLNRLPFKFSDTYHYGYACSDVQLASYLRGIGNSYSKRIPREFLDLPSRQLRILFDWMMKGDGSRDERVEDKYRKYSSVSKGLADDFQELTLKIGFAATVSYCPEQGGFKNSGIWRVYVSYKSLTPEVNRNMDRRKYVDYDGLVYCVEVPNHIIYIRRNGRACWCGNCGPIARNTGAREADGKYLFFCDAHTTPGRNTINILADYLADNPNVGCVIGQTAKSHFDQLRMGAHFELFHQDMEMRREGGPTLATHMHGSYMTSGRVAGWAGLDPLKPYPCVMGHQAYVMYRRDEFWDMGGYLETCRYYPHPEGYMPLKFLRAGKEVHIHPDSWHLHGNWPRNYHGSGPERRRKLRENAIIIDGIPVEISDQEHGRRNVMMVANVLGGDKWLDICFEALKFKHNNPRNLELLKESARVASTPVKDELESKFEKTLDEVLIESRKNRLPGMSKWDTRVSITDPLA